MRLKIKRLRLSQMKRFGQYCCPETRGQQEKEEKGKELDHKDMNKIINDLN